jgi:nitroreductase
MQHEPSATIVPISDPEQKYDTPIFKIRKAMPVSLKHLYRRLRAAQEMVGASIYDARNYWRYSGSSGVEHDVASRKASITKYYHMIEKGLTLPQPRPGFGKVAIRDLCEKIDCALKEGSESNEISHALDALIGYQSFNREHGVESPYWIADTLCLAEAKGFRPMGRPTRAPEPVSTVQAKDLIAFITSRHSVRNFSDEPIPDGVLEAATRAAQSAPCVCNRQAARVYFARETEMKRKLLACQNGNRGFGQTAGAVAVVTVDLRSFLNASERYQAWIDGGLFAMNLLLGFHAQNYATCCLNWSALPAQDKALRSLNIIPSEEIIVMMIAIGKPSPDHTVARSERRDTSDVMRLI